MNFDDQFHDIDVICFDLVCSNRVRFFVIYRPPYYDNSAAEYIRRVIKCVATYESPRCTNIIVGDINLPKINWKTLSCSNDSFNWPFVSFLIESSYNQIIDFPTHDDNILDVVLTTDVNIVDHVRPDVPFGASDHAMVLFSVTFVSDSQYRVDESPFCVYNWDLADYDAIENDLLDVDWYSLVTMHPSAPHLWDEFMSILYATIEWHVPKRNSAKHRNTRKPYTRSTRDLRKCLAKKRYLWRQLRNNKCDTQVRVKYRECVCLWRSLVQQQQMRVEERLIESNNMSSFYKFVNKRSSNHVAIGPIIDRDKVVVTDNYDKACVFNDYFTSVGQTDNGSVPACANSFANHLDMIDVNESNVLAAIRKLKSNYSCGPDGLPPMFFKRLQYTIAKPLALIYNQLLSVAHVPDDWKKAIITPIYKKGPVTDYSNYRPISLTCVASKILERVIAKQIREHLISNNLLHSAQHGFVSGRSTCTNLLECFNDWTLYLQDRHQVVIVYIDFSKAFDVVSHNKLFTRLQSYGISGTLLSWLQKFFTGRTQCTKIGAVLSHITDVISGVIQGSVLGPLMFLTFVNELAELLANCGIIVKFFADDVKLYARIINDVDVNTLQAAVDALCRWAEAWQLPLSINKCCVLHVGQSTSNVPISVSGLNLPCVTSCRDLGITVVSDLTPTTHINNIVVKAHQRANAIHRCFVSRNTDLLVRAYLVYVRPLLEHNSVVWSPYYKYDIEAIERVQRRFTKRLPGFKEHSYKERLKLLQLPSLELRRLHCDLIWCYKIVFGLVSLEASTFFDLRPSSITRGHPYKIFKRHCYCTARSEFFSERVINIWNGLPLETVNFSTLPAFKRSINKVDLSKYCVVTEP